MAKRFDFIYNKIKHLKTSRGVEIGVADGATSVKLLSMHSGLVLYSIDPYVMYPKYYSKNQKDRQHGSGTQEDFDKQYDRMKIKLSQFGDRSRFLRATSEIGSKHFANDSLDFVFIDANHLYKSVKQDIQLWWPKVKSGGYLFGHDYNPNALHLVSNVVKAVNECFPKGINRGYDTIWWVQK